MMMMMMMMMMMITITVLVIVLTRTARLQLNKVRPKAYIGASWQPLYGPCMKLDLSQQPARTGCVTIFAEGGKPAYPEKKPWSRVQN